MALVSWKNSEKFCNSKWRNRYVSKTKFYRAPPSTMRQITIHRRAHVLAQMALRSDIYELTPLKVEFRFLSAEGLRALKQVGLPIK